MPVSVVVTGARPRRVPVVQDPFRVGRGADVDLVVTDDRAAATHASIRVKDGEYQLEGTRGESVFVNGKRVPLKALRHGDEIRLLDPGLGSATVLRFENRLGEVLVPVGSSLAAAWMAHAAFREKGHGPDAYGKGQALGGRDPTRCRVVREAGTARRILVKVVGPVRSAAEGDQHLALLAALAGAPHPSLVPVVDGGLAPGRDGPVRWIATDWVEGACVRDRLATDGPFDPARALGILLELAGGLTHLHARGAIHRDVSPANVVLSAAGPAVLIDPGQAGTDAGVRPLGPGVVGTPGYLAPEAVLAGHGVPTPAADVYGLAAVGYALLTGRPPAVGGDVLESLARAARPPMRPSDLGVDLPPPLEAALLEALAPEPRSRPTARAFERTLAFARASLGLGERT